MYQERYFWLRTFFCLRVHLIIRTICRLCVRHIQIKLHKNTFMQLSSTKSAIYNLCKCGAKLCKQIYTHISLSNISPRYLCPSVFHLNLFGNKNVLYSMLLLTYRGKASIQRIWESSFQRFFIQRKYGYNMAMLLIQRIFFA